MIGKYDKQGTPIGVVSLTEGSEVQRREATAEPSPPPSGAGQEAQGLDLLDKAKAKA
jgi:hypothetical protein